MQMQQVQSSNVRAVGYDPASRLMRVEFSNGSTYEYDDVSGGDFDSIVSSDSIGRSLRSVTMGRSYKRVDK